jgi:glucose-1-phosphate adenylyltransferase
LTIYVFRTEFLYEGLKKVSPYLKQKETVEFGRDLIPVLVNENPNKYRIYGYKHSGFWGYTRTLAEFWQANMSLLFQRNQIDLEKWQVRTNLDHRGIRDRQPAVVKKNANVKNSLICNGCIVHGEVVNSILSPGVVVGKNARVYNSIIMFDTKIHEQAFLNNVILDVDIDVASKISLGSQKNLEAKPSELYVFGEGERLSL